jgi:hypothetical protein
MEGLVFLPIAIVLAKSYGLVGVLIASMVAHLAVTTVLSTRAATRILGSPVRITKGLMASLALITAAAAAGWIGAYASAPPFAMLAVAGGISLLTLIAIWQFILPNRIRLETGTRLETASHKLRSLLGRNA